MQNLPHPDRRKQNRRSKPTSPLTASSLFGKRKNIRRHEDSLSQPYVDLYSFSSVLSILVTLILSVTDAFFTLQLISLGYLILKFKICYMNSAEETVSQKPISVIRVGGYLEFTTSDELDKVIESLVKTKSYNIIIDLENVGYISSRGWSIFLSKIKEIRENDGDLKLTRMAPDVFEVFKVLEFFWFLGVYDTIEEAISDFDHGVPPLLGGG